MIGLQGYETLEKAIFKRGTSAVVDPLEFYLPLIVVPRTILSWLIQNVKPMKRGEVKDVKFPGKDDIFIHFEKQDVDQYRADFIQNGRVIHSFEKQSLPAVSGHLMSVGEMYEDFADEKKAPGQEGYTEQFSEKVKEKIEESPRLDVVKQIISMSDIKPSSDAESVKWEMSHANVRELTGVIGKLVDALMIKETSRNKVEAELDKMAVKEVEGEEQEIEDCKTPEDQYKDHQKAKANLKTIESDGLSEKELAQEAYKPQEESEVPEQKVIESDEGKITKQSLSETKTTEPAMTPAEAPKKPAEHIPPAPTTPMVKASDYFRKKAEILMKPKAMEKAEMPKGAGQPMKPSMPQPPKPAVPPGNNPAGAAAKQAQASARGSYTPPKTPGAPKPQNPTSKPKAAMAPKANQGAAQDAAAKAASVNKNEYFKAKIKKKETYTATEDELYKSKCPHCNVPEFKKSETGSPEFNPCACFSVMKKDEEGQPYKFVNVIKKSETGNFELKFHKSADPDSVKVFLLTLKAHLLVKRKFNV